MTNESMEEIIDRANSPEASESIFFRPLTDSVKRARVWLVDPATDVHPAIEGSEFYLIYDPSETCIAAVYIMGSHDLHVFVKSDFRRQGVMKTALREAVFPHQRFLGKELQDSTFDSEKSENLLRSIGFQILNDTRARLDLSRFKPLKHPEGPFQVEREFIEPVRARFRRAAACVTMSLEESRDILSDNFCERLEELIDELHSLNLDTEDDWWDQEDYHRNHRS